LGVLQASVPAEYGGFGERSLLTSILAAEAIAWGDLAGAMAVMLPSLFATPVLICGSEEQKKEYLPKIVDGDWQPYTAALIEYQFDFDPQALAATAVEKGGQYILNGEKRFVPYAETAEAILVYANLDGKTQGFIVPKGSDGLTIGEKDLLMGLNAIPFHSLHLDQVKVPKSSRLGGEEGHDFAPILDASWVTLSAMAVGMAQAAFEYSRDYAKEREVLGSMIAQKQSIAFMLAEMATEIEAIRLLTWEAAWMIDNGVEGASRAAYLAHQGAADMAMMVTDRGVQILGGHGYIREHPVELWMRNGRGIYTLTGLALA